MKPDNRAPFAFCIFRGFTLQDDGPTKIIVRKKAVTGTWVTGHYVFDSASDTHFVLSEAGSKYEVIPETLGMQDPFSKRWPGDTCFANGVRGVVRFGRHYDCTTYNREEVHYYIEWLGNSLDAMTKRTDLLYWTKQSKDALIWVGTIWDPKSEWGYFLEC